MASKKSASPDPQPEAEQPAGPAVIRRYHAYGEARELGIAAIPHGYIVIEQLEDGTFRLAEDQGADEWETAALEVPTSTSAEPEPEAGAEGMVVRVEVLGPATDADAADTAENVASAPAADESTP